jgi:hypothetical protein
LIVLLAKMFVEIVRKSAEDLHMRKAVEKELMAQVAELKIVPEASQLRRIYLSTLSEALDKRRTWKAGAEKTIASQLGKLCLTQSSDSCHKNDNTPQPEKKDMTREWFVHKIQKLWKKFALEYHTLKDKYTTLTFARSIRQYPLLQAVSKFRENTCSLSWQAAQAFTSKMEHVRVAWQAVAERAACEPTVIGPDIDRLIGRVFLYQLPVSDTKLLKLQKFGFSVTVAGGKRVSSAEPSSIDAPVLSPTSTLSPPKSSI